jgi:DNA-binding NarL/FixJ family response regulator
MSLTILNEDETNAHLEALSGGQWEIVDQFDQSGRRYIVAVREPHVEPRPRRLTEREASVVMLVARGYSNKLVAYELGLSVSTVAGHIAMAMARLGVTSRVGLVARWNLLNELHPQASSGAAPTTTAAAAAAP